MKQYPSITHEISSSLDIYGFDKLDGSNIRAEWDRKKKFHKFGARHRLLDQNEKPLGEAVELVKSKYEQALSDIFMKERFEKAIIFLEFLGPNSFAGNHVDEDHDVKLLDVSVYKKGLILPNRFIKLFGHLDTAKLLYMGKANQEFVESVRNGTLEGMSFEGVVCKGIETRKGKEYPFMFKVKNQAWIRKLKEYCKGDENLFNSLL